MNILKERILKEMVINLDAIQIKLRDEIYQNIASRKLKPEFENMSTSELLEYIEKRLGELKGE